MSVTINPGQVVSNESGRYKFICCFDSYFDDPKPEVHCRRFLKKKSKKQGELLSKRIFRLTDYVPEEPGQL